MRITVNSIVPNKEAFEPELILDLKIEYDVEYAFFSFVNGRLSVDGKKVGNIFKYDFDSNETNLLSVPHNNYQRNSNQKYCVSLSRISIEKIEEIRSKSIKGELVFAIEMCFDTIVSGYKYQRILLETGELNVVHIENSERFLLKKRGFTSNAHHKISSGDWIHDYLSVFDEKNYILFEVPIPNPVVNEHAFSDHINEAIKGLKDMEAAKKEGDWVGVIKESRPVWELLRWKKDITELLINENYNEHVVNSFDKLIDSFFQFSAKFIHKEAQGSKALIINDYASKEDAELIYTMAFALVNLIARKVSKFNS